MSKPERKPTASDAPLVTFSAAPLAGERLAEAVRIWEVMLEDGFTEDNGRKPDEECTAAVALDADGQTLGMAVLFEPEGEDFAWLWLLYVDPDARRKNVGLGLLRFSIEAAWALWGKPIGFGTQGHNLPMQRLALRAAFEIEAVFYHPKAPEARHVEA